MEGDLISEGTTICSGIIYGLILQQQSLTAAKMIYGFNIQLVRFGSNYFPKHQHRWIITTTCHPLLLH